MTCKVVLPTVERSSGKNKKNIIDLPTVGRTILRLNLNFGTKKESAMNGLVRTPETRNAAICLPNKGDTCTFQIGSRENALKALLA
ncbi:hypothetical protein EGJ57_12690 [Brucella anthropi]|nr:hypothetical protein EGJ58_22910 [Brucella anthropi]RRY19023.1 hypothetical protein EGJ57_12690 [Brucella anthropi]